MGQILPSPFCFSQFQSDDKTLFYQTMTQILLRIITIMVQTIDILLAMQPLGSISEAKAKS